MSNEIEVHHTVQPEVEIQLAAAKELNYTLRKEFGNTERQNSQIRSDMQSLNDLYHTVNNKLLSAEKELSTSLKENQILKKFKNSDASLKVQISQELQVNALLQVQLKDLREANEVVFNEKEGIIEVHQLEIRESLKLINSMKDTEVTHKRNLQNMQAKTVSMQELIMMSLEDKESTDIRSEMLAIKIANENTTLNNEISILQIHHERLQIALIDRETELIAEQSSFQMKIIEMKEVTSILKVQNKELEEDLSTLSDRLCTAISDGKIQHDESAKLSLDMASLNAEQLQTKADSNILLERNNYLLLQLETVDSEMKVLTSHIIEENANHLNERQLEMQRNKEHEDRVEQRVEQRNMEYKEQVELLVAETKRNEEREEQLSAQARKKSFHVIAMEAKQMKTERDALQEQLNSQSLVLALRGDLEKQSAEMIQMISELNAVKEANACFLQMTAELESTIKMKDKKALEYKSVLEEAKKSEILSRNFGVERQELLLENKNLASELDTSKRDLANLRGELGSFNEQMIWLTNIRTSLEEQNIELRKQLDSALGLQVSLQLQIDPLRQSLQEKESALSSLDASSTLDMRAFKDSLQVQSHI
jgi:hypothetical protein